MSSRLVDEGFRKFEKVIPHVDKIEVGNTWRHDIVCIDASAENDIKGKKWGVYSEWSDVRLMIYSLELIQRNDRFQLVSSRLYDSKRKSWWMIWLNEDISSNSSWKSSDKMMHL